MVWVVWWWLEDWVLQGCFFFPHFSVNERLWVGVKDRETMGECFIKAADWKTFLRCTSWVQRNINSWLARKLKKSIHFLSTTDCDYMPGARVDWPLGFQISFASFLATLIRRFGADILRPITGSENKSLTKTVLTNWLLSKLSHFLTFENSLHAFLVSGDEHCWLLALHVPEE